MASGVCFGPCWNGLGGLRSATSFGRQTHPSVFLLVLWPNSFVHNQAHLKAVGSPLLGALLA
jgi:hypothetical protein